MAWWPADTSRRRSRGCSSSPVYLYHPASEFFTAAGDDRRRRHLPGRQRQYAPGRTRHPALSGPRPGAAGCRAVDDRDHRRLRRGRYGNHGTSRRHGRWRLYGRKWFTSAITPTLPSPGPAWRAGAGADALACSTWSHAAAMAAGALAMHVQRLKDKLGTRELPTAEIHLDGAPETVGELRRRAADRAHAGRHAHLERGMRHCHHAARHCLLRDYANRRVVFARPLADRPAPAGCWAGSTGEFEAAFHFTFCSSPSCSGACRRARRTKPPLRLLRLLTPLAKLWTGRLAVTIASEVLEDSAARVTSRTPVCPNCCAMRRSSPSGKAPATCRRSTCCAPCHSREDWQLPQCAARAAGPGGRGAGSLRASGARIHHAPDGMAAAPDHGRGLEAGAREFALGPGALPRRNPAAAPRQLGPGARRTIRARPRRRAASSPTTWSISLDGHGDDARLLASDLLP